MKKKNNTSNHPNSPLASASDKPLSANQIISLFKDGGQVDLRPHAAAEVFSRLYKKELDELAADIKRNGLRYPITLHPDGSILDGNNRFKACISAGIKPTFETWDGKPGEEIDYVIRMNLLRRHMADKQRSMTAVKLAKLGRGRRKKADLPVFTQREAAAALNVSERSVRTAQRVSDAAPPNIASLVQRNLLALDPAEAVAKLPDEDKARIAVMNDEEAIAAALSANSINTPLAETKGKFSLVRRLEGFLEQYSRANDEARTHLGEWLQQEPNAAALDALKAMINSLSQHTAERDARA